MSGVSKGRLCPLGTRGSILRKIMPVSTFLFSLFWCKFDLGMKMCKAPFLRDDQLSPIFLYGAHFISPGFWAALVKMGKKPFPRYLSRVESKYKVYGTTEGGKDKEEKFLFYLSS